MARIFFLHRVNRLVKITVTLHRFRAKSTARVLGIDGAGEVDDFGAKEDMGPLGGRSSYEREGWD